MSRVHVEEPESLFQNVHFPTLKITHVQLSTVSQCLVSPRNLKSTTDNTQPCTSTKCLTEVNGKVFIFIPFVSISSVVCPIRIISEVKNTTVEDLNSHILRSHTDDVRQTGLQYKLHSGQGSSQNPVTAHQHQVYVTVYSKMMAFSVLNVKLHM